MSQQWPPPSGSSAAGQPDDDWRHQTTPGLATAGAAPPPGQGPGYGTVPPYSTRPVAVRRADPLASLLLLLAGIAAGVSLLLDWLPNSNLTGLDLVRRGLSQLVHHFGQLPGSGLWQPLAIVLGGGVLFVIGLLMLIPARAHRFLGLLALLVTLCVGAGVLVPLADAGWHLGRFGVGFWFACAVAVLGLLGSLKALFTGPRAAPPQSATSAP
jgi:hypothetical protein